MTENIQDQPVSDRETDETGAEPPSRQPPAKPEAQTFLQRVAHYFRPRNGTSLRDDLTDALADVKADTAAFTPEERAMLHNILRLREVRVEDVMVPRADVDAVEISTSLGDLMTLFESSGHSRMPVYAETLDDPRGMIHIRDVLAHVTKLSRTGKRRRTNTKKAAEAEETEPRPFDLSCVDLTKPIGELGLIRPVLFVPPSMLASELMARMKAARIQMGLVIDEYGGTDGLVSLEDIVEMVVGDIEDEHDDEEPMIIQTGEGIFVVDARAEIDEVADTIGGGFSAGEHAEDVDTIGGMIFNTIGRVPVRGEVIQAIPGYEFHVLDADPRRVKRVRIVQGRAAAGRRRLPKAEQQPASKQA
ncbi:MAG: hemolysin family protein [Notoacmeibacter sp.]|nr:hemolysin family protein [Notoacmeibacter sp.]